MGVTEAREGLSSREGVLLISAGGRIEVPKGATLLSVWLFGGNEQLSTFVCGRTETRRDRGGEHALGEFLLSLGVPAPGRDL